MCGNEVELADIEYLSDLDNTIDNGEFREILASLVGNFTDETLT